MEGEIVDINVRLKQVVPETTTFQNIVRCSFEFPEAWVATSRLDNCLLACCGWWLVTVKKRKICS